MYKLSYFQEAKAYFIASHQNPINIFLHHLTVLLAISAVVLLFYDWRWTLVCLVLTQVFAIGGHTLFEKNQPAFVKYRNGIMIPVSISWSFENLFGLRQLWRYFQSKNRLNEVGSRKSEVGS